MTTIDRLRLNMFREKVDAPVQGAVDFVLGEGALAKVDLMKERRPTREQLLTVPLDLPFKKCFFGAEKKPLQTIVDDNGDYTELVSFFAYEVAPCNYLFMSDVAYNLDNGKKKGEGGALASTELHLGGEDRDVEGFGMYYSMAKNILSVINDSKKAEIKPRKQKQKCWHKGQRQTYKPSGTIYINGNKREKTKPAVAGYQFTRWIEAWRVRGHWRKYEGGIGKDRNGERCVEGYTWVSAYEKGEGILAEKKYKVTG